MERIYGLEGLTPDRRSVVTVGTFDGVHRGHQALLRYVQERASRYGGRSVAVSFDPHPKEVVTGQPVPLLTTIDERAEALAKIGLDRFVVIPFTQAFSQLRGKAFIREVLAAQIGLQEIVIGYDHGFGRGREGDAELLQELGAELRFAVDVIPAQVVEAHVVSSTEIRHQLTETGDVALAREMLGRAYSLEGTVISGDQRGRTIGYPTANLERAHPRKVVPKIGVYAVEVMLPEGEAVPGMMNIGRRPTFDGVALRQEVHLLDFEGDLYGQTLRVAFIERLRDEQKFNGIDALVQQLSQDEARCRAVFR